MLDNLFVCIGAQKAGTTWLYSVLSKDNQFARCPFVKEVHYFDYLYKNSKNLNDWRSMSLVHFIKNKEEIRKTIKIWLNQKQNNSDENDINVKKLNLLTDKIDDHWYENIFSLQKNSKYALDITPYYAIIGVDGFQHIKRIAKNKKILFILRNPVDRAWSGLLEGKKRIDGGIERFIMDIESEKISIDQLYKICSTGADVGARSNYLNTIINLEEAGLLEQTKIMFYDDLSSKPEDFIAEIYNFLEIDIPKDNAEFNNAILTKKYETVGKKEMPEDLRVRLQQFYSNTYSQLEKYIDIPSSWK